MDDVDGAIGGMIGRGNGNIRRNPVPVPLCPLKVAHDMTLARTRFVALRSRRLSA
jgi:hypothetical protein